MAKVHAALPNASKLAADPSTLDAVDLLGAFGPLQAQKVDLATQMVSSLADMLLIERSTEGSWRDMAHDFQLPPEGDWTIWTLMAGRGSGKTRAAAEYITDEIVAGRAKVIGFIGPTAADVRDVMVEGPAGVVKIAEMRGIQCYYQPSKRRVVWPEYGASATLFSAEKPRRLRGPQHDHLWCEEVAAWQDAWAGDAEETTWNNAMFGLRLGANPRCVVTTTPKTNKITRLLKERAQESADYVITSGSTYANRKNLAPAFFNQVIARYEGTRLGRQEIMGILLEDVEGALWQHEWIDRGRIQRGDWYDDWRQRHTNPPEPIKAPVRLDQTLPLPVPREPDEFYDEPSGPAPLPDLVRMVVAIDPNTSSDPNADEAGIVIAARGVDGRGYVFDDRSETIGPTEWAKLAVRTYHEWRADKILAERNNGGEMVKITIDQVTPEGEAKPKVELVWASRGKITRAEPVATLYEQGKISHVGEFPELEDQLCTYVPGEQTSPGRLDALVWCFTDLFDLTMEGPDQRSRKLMVF